MRPVDLAAEMLAAVERVQGGIADRMRALRIPIDEDRPLVGLARIVTTPDGTFEPHPEGAPHIIVAEGIHEPSLGWREIIDLVAFRSDAPDRWWLRRDMVDVLGSDGIDKASFARRPLILHPTPLAWLQAGAQGACVVHWSLDPRSVFAGITDVVCATAALRRRLEQRLAEVSRPHLNVTVKRETRNVAA